MRICIAAVMAFIIMGGTSFAAEVTLRTQEQVQASLNKKLPLTFRRDKWVEIVLQPGTTVQLKGRNNILIAGPFILTYKDRPVLKGTFNAVTAIRYAREGQAIYLDQTALARENGFYTELVRKAPDSSPRSRFGKLKKWGANVGANVVDAGLDKYLNNKTALRTMLAALVIDWAQSKPVFRANPADPAQALILPFLSEENLVVKEGRIVLQTPE